MRLSPKFLWFLTLLPVLFGFDMATKRAVEGALPVGGEIPLVAGALSIFHAQNPDVAFSMPVPLALVYAFGVVAVGLIGWTLLQLPGDSRVRASALAAIAGGALGNLVDRFGDGSVTDFVRVYTENPDLAPWLIQTFGTATWPIFNVADASLLGGVFLWISHDLFRDDPVATASRPDTSASDPGRPPEPPSRPPVA